MGLFDAFKKGFKDSGITEDQRKVIDTYAEELKRMGMTEDQFSKIGEEIIRKKEELGPPRVAFVGLTGVGKSSTLNALFNAGQPTSDIEPCTKKEAEIYGEYSTYKGSKGRIIVYDMPGLGEDIDMDPIHMETYKKVLPEANVIVWTIAATDRKMKPEQEALRELYKLYGEEFTDRLVVVINKIDSIAPGETHWNRKLNMPSLQQQENIKIEIEHVTKKIKRVLPNWNRKVVAYSARYGFRLEELMESLVEATESNERFNLDSIADVMNQTDLMDPRYKEIVNKMLEERKK